MQARLALPAGLLGALLLVTGCDGSRDPRAPAEAAATASGTPAPDAARPSPAPDGAGGRPTAEPAPTVPAVVRSLRPAVPLRSPAPLGAGAQATVLDARRVTSAGTGPGQAAGRPALQLTLQLVAGTAPLSVDATVVDVRRLPDGAPASPVEGGPARPFRGMLAPGGRARGVYVVGLPPGAPTTRVRVLLTTGADRTTVVLEGVVPQD